MEIIQQLLSYNGLNLYLNTSDSNLFYKNIDKIVSKDRLNYKTEFSISCDFFDNYIQTNVLQIFIDMFYQSLAAFNIQTSTNKTIRIEIEKENIIHEIIVSFDKKKYYEKERIINGESHDYSTGEFGGVIYDPKYNEKNGDINEFSHEILKEIKEILNISSCDSDIEYIFGGEFHNKYIEIEKTSDKLWFICKLKALFDKYWDCRDYFEGHILISKCDDEQYQIEFYCDADGMSLIPEGKDEIKFEYYEAFNAYDEDYPDEDIERDKKTFNEFIFTLNEIISHV